VAFWAVVAWGLSMAVLVVDDSSWWWMIVGTLCVAVVGVGVLAVVRRGGRASLLVVAAGAVAVVAGAGIGVVHLVKAGDLLPTVAGLTALVAGLVLVVWGTRASVRGRSTSAHTLIGTVVIVGLVLVSFTFIPAVMATNAPRPELGETPESRGVPYRSVAFDTSDGVKIAGWYIASANGAAVVMRHGAGSTRSDVVAHATALAQRGYGVLLTDARGHGESGGRAMEFGWFGDVDIQAAVSFLAERPEVDADRIGVVGMSMGGEEAIGAAAADSRIRAVVAEGVTARTDADVSWLSDVYGARGTFQEGVEWLRFTMTDLLTSAGKPIRLATAIEQTPATAFLVIAGGAVEDERHVLAYLSASNPANLEIWMVPDAGHTEGLSVAPAEWQHTVVSFLDRHLGGRGD
jgi:dienelactone hydrolase